MVAVFRSIISIIIIIIIIIISSSCSSSSSSSSISSGGGGGSSSSSSSIAITKRATSAGKKLTRLFPFCIIQYDVVYYLLLRLVYIIIIIN